MLKNAPILFRESPQSAASNDQHTIAFAASARQVQTHKTFGFQPVEQCALMPVGTSVKAGNQQSVALLRTRLKQMAKRITLTKQGFNITAFRDSAQHFNQAYARGGTFGNQRHL